MLSTNKKNHKLIVENNIEYYYVDGLDSIKKEMLRLLNIINNISQENNIEYWIDGGSLIGVIRHDGFIPWDDDLDISLLKKDYHKLVQALSDYTSSHNDAYLFFQAPQDYHTCNYFASKSIFSRTEGSAIAVPVKIDIRPVNCIQNDRNSIEKNNILRDTANYLIFGKSYGYLKEIPQNKVEIQRFFSEYNNHYGFEDPCKCDVTLVHSYFEFSAQFELMYNDIFPLKKHIFENIEVPIPNNYHYLQTKLYGNYMEMPSLEHRAPVACNVYKRHVSDFTYKKYIEMVFKNMPSSSLFQRILINLLLIRLIGIFDYFKSKFIEKYTVSN